MRLNPPVISFALALFVQQRRHVAQKREQDELIAKQQLEIRYLTALPIQVDRKSFEKLGITRGRPYKIMGTDPPESLTAQIERALGCKISYRATPTLIIISAAENATAANPIALQSLNIDPPGTR
jgi:hypothetical protein